MVGSRETGPEGGSPCMGTTLMYEKMTRSESIRPGGPLNTPNRIQQYKK